MNELFSAEALFYIGVFICFFLGSGLGIIIGWILGKAKKKHCIKDRMLKKKMGEPCWRGMQ